MMQIEFVGRHRPGKVASHLLGAPVDGLSAAIFLTS
jgi:hypothetical protein